MSEQLTGKAMNLDVHPNLLESGDIIYLLNGDVDGSEGNVDEFIQNVLANELCYTYPENYTLKGAIKLDGFKYALFFDTPTYGEIGVLNTNTCQYTMSASGTCLDFQQNVRGVFKKDPNGDNVVYFIDGVTDNRYLNLDQPFPKTLTGSYCTSCNVSETGTLNCDKLSINRSIKPPCISIDDTNFGGLPAGTYQVGIAYGEDDLTFTDFYLSPLRKVHSESSNIGLEVSIDCINIPFDQYRLVLVSNTQESGLVVYDFGYFQAYTNSITITDIENTTILSTQELLNKRPVFDKSEHIVTNGESLFLGKHASLDTLDYQLLACDIGVNWLEVKVPKEEAYKYPSFMRDEIYAIAIEWIGDKGNSRGVFDVPGRAPTVDDLIIYGADDFATNDIYETEDCSGATRYKWQIENTASVDIDLAIPCNNCSGEIVNKYGTMGYWESADYSYPNDTDKWGALACQPIRHHRMPGHDLTHIHDDFTETVEAADPADCYTIEVPDQAGTGIVEYDFCPSGQSIVVESDCVNILAIELTNIEHPTLPNGDYDPDISGYRILVSDRKGNKSILHKGLLFNVQRDTSNSGTGSEILYPNYPFNDLHGDIFLSAVETEDNYDGSNYPAGWQAPNAYYRDQFTYHSPDIHFREIQNEFGTELKVYGESIGWIDGEFKNVYLHPMTRLGRGGITSLAYTNHAAQLNSVCNYSKFSAWSTPLFSRFQILSSQYLLPVNQILSNGKKLNNTYRESSYYVELGRTLSNPTNIDTSRVLASEFGYAGLEPLPKFNYYDEVSRVDGGVLADKKVQGVSYYAGIKRLVPNQYGSLEDINYRPVGCHTAVFFDVDNPITPYTSPVIYGGDVYITRHSLVRKMPIFSQWLEDVPIDTEINYQNYRNLWYPRFWYDNESQADDRYNLDGFVDAATGGDIYAGGKFYVFVTGVINYWCESEFIGNFRERDATPNGNFYPKADYNDLVTTDKIRYDNKFLYNFALLNNELEILKQDLTPTELGNDFVVSFSLKDDQQSTNDKWLQFLPLNYTVLPRIYGDFTGMHFTDDYSLLFIFENEILYSQLDYRITTQEGNSILLAQGDIFSNRLRKFSNELSTGYTGSVDPLSFINTRYGTMYIDRYRKKIFLWAGGQLQDVTGNMSSWLNQFMNNNNPQYLRSIKAIFDNYSNNVYFTSGEDRDRWTFSWKPSRQGVLSFHSFVPDWYLSAPNTFLSTNSTGIWRHNDRFNYQSYYGSQVPFEVGLFINNQYVDKELQDVQMFVEFSKHLNYGEPIFKKDMFFDKVWSYSSNGSTGWMTVNLKDRSNALSATQNSDTNNPIVVDVTQVKSSIYRFNKFEDIFTGHGTLPMVDWDATGMFVSPVNVDPTINPRERNDIKGDWMKLHLRSEDNTEYKILCKLVLSKQQGITI